MLSLFAAFMFTWTLKCMDKKEWIYSSVWKKFKTNCHSCYIQIACQKILCMYYILHSWENMFVSTLGIKKSIELLDQKQFEDIAQCVNYCVLNCSIIGLILHSNLQLKFFHHAKYATLH